MTALTQEQLAKLRAQLEAREAQLGSELRDLNSEAAQTPSRVSRDTVGDVGDQGEERIRTAVRAAEQERDIMELRQIADAKERIELGSYGVCIDCGRDIALARLQALPFSERCLPCQEAFERAHPIGVRIPRGMP